jgi:hypothetical protein
MPSEAAKNKGARLPGGLLSAVVGAVVAIVSVEDAEADPGVTDVGLKVQVVSDGKFEQASDTVLPKAP